MAKDTSEAASQSGRTTAKNLQQPPYHKGKERNIDNKHYLWPTVMLISHHYKTLKFFELESDERTY